MEFLRRTDDERMFRELWTRGLSAGQFDTLFYSLDFLDYMRQSKFLVEDLSFIGVEKGLIRALVPLFLEKHDDHLQFSFAGNPIQSPMCFSDAAEKEAFVHIEKLAVAKNVVLSMFMILPSIWLYADNKNNTLQRYGYLDASIATNLIPLARSEKEMLSAMRHGHGSLISTRRKDYGVRMADHTNHDFELHERYRELHKRAAGRVTRKIESFDMQFQMLKDDEALLIGLSRAGQLVAAVYFFHSKRLACYGSVGKDPDLDLKGTDHVIVSEALKYYKNRGLQYLDMGWQQFGPQPLDLPTEKNVSISFYKRGFGGFNAPLFVGKRYYDPSLLKKELDVFFGTVTRGKNS